MIIVFTPSDNTHKKMRSILVISVLVVAVYGRPEPPSGYQYPSPSRSYGSPSGNNGFSQGGQSGYSQGGQSGYSQGGQSGYSQGGQSGFNQGGQSGFNGFEQSAFGGSSSGATGGFSSQSANDAQASAGSYASSGGHSSSSSNGHSSGERLVHKHVYVHVAPPDAEEKTQPKAKVVVPPPQKHYKIIFIKAPTPPAPTVPEIPPFQQDEEKTLVYVLVKKPEEQPIIEIPTAAPTEPSKPEVYFIKYKAQKEEQHGSEHQDFQGGAVNDDSVVVDARQNGGSQNGSSQNGAYQNGASQNGASQNSATQYSASSGSSSASSSSASASFSSSGPSSAVPSSQYGPARQSGPY